MLVKSRLPAVLALALALAFVAASGSLLGSEKQLAGATAVPMWALDDDRGDGAFALVPRLVVVLMLFFGLALLVLRSPALHQVAREPRRARGPPSR